MSIFRNKRVNFLRRLSIAARTLPLCAVSTAGAGHGAFNYDPIIEPIVSASFSADFAALVAHRTIFGEEVNMLRLLDISTGGPDLDLADDFFGTADWPDSPQIDMGDLETGIFSVAIDPSFFPALVSGHVGLGALFTDTDDALFAIDFLSLTINTLSSEIIESFYGWPPGDENNGFGIGLRDFEDLPAPFPGVLKPNGSGFHEEISFKAIHVPEPGSLLLLAVGASWMRRRRNARATTTGSS